MSLVIKDIQVMVINLEVIYMFNKAKGSKVKYIYVSKGYLTFYNMHIYHYIIL